MKEYNNIEHKKLLDMLVKEKDIKIQPVIDLVLKDAYFFKEILNGFTSKKENFRLNCFNIIRQIILVQPYKVYQEWDYFVQLLKSSNAYHRYSGLYIIAELTEVDKDKRFEQIFDDYFNLLNDDKVMVTAHLAGNSGRIIRNKPHLEEKILEKLFRIEKIYQNKQRIDLVTAYVIQALDDIIEVSSFRKEILGFVRKHLDSTSPKTRKLAKDFIGKYC